jgi:ParB family chromosome partitioning protein
MYSDSRGSVKITSRDPAVHPELRFNYLSTPMDRREWVEAIAITRRILNQPAFAPYNAGELSPGPDVVTDEQVLDWVARDGETALHPSCTCAMGTGDRAVVDPASMKVHGVIVPLVVRPRPEGGYFLIAGERRWRAAQRAGLHEIPVVVQDVEQGTALERALVENLQRADLGPLEEAGAYQRLADEFGLTQEAIAERIGKDRSTIANSIRLLKLPPPVRQLVEDERLSMGHARALLALDEPAAIERAARQVVDRQLSVRATEALVKKAKEPEDNRPPARPQKSASVRDLEERLTRALGGPVAITEDEPGKAGRIEIRYMNLDHLERLLDRLL